MPFQSTNKNDFYEFIVPGNTDQDQDIYITIYAKRYSTYNTVRKIHVLKDESYNIISSEAIQELLNDQLALKID